MQKYSHNYTMLCDFYELTMGNGYFVSGMKDTVTYFDLFYRTVPRPGRLRHSRRARAGGGLYQEPAL